MCRTLVALLCLVGLSLGIAGCAEKTQVKEQTRIDTPGGSSTKTVTVEERKTGDLKDNNTTTTDGTTTTPAPNP